MKKNVIFIFTENVGFKLKFIVDLEIGIHYMEDSPPFWKVPMV